MFDLRSLSHTWSVFDRHFKHRRNTSLGIDTLRIGQSAPVKMSANPALVRMHDGELIPSPFASEMFVLRRSGVILDLDAVETSNGK